MPDHYQREVYVEPTSLAEAIAWRDRLNKEIHDIESQLALRNLEAGGVRPSDPKYRGWRIRALHAIGEKRAIVLKLKAWIRVASAAPKEKRQTGQPNPKHLARSGMAPTDLAGEMRLMVGHLYSLYNAVGRYLEDATDETEDGLERAYDTAKTFLDGGR